MDFITVYIKSNSGDKQEIELVNDPAFSLMELLRAAELPVLGTCGGMALCASCHVYILSDQKLPEPNEDEIRLLDSLPNSKMNSRLSCQLKMSDSLDQLHFEIASE